MIDYPLDMREDELLAVDAGSMVATVMIGAKGDATEALRLLRTLDSDRVRQIGETAIRRSVDLLSEMGAKG